MSKLSPLMIEYIDKRPLSAVKVLSEMDAGDVADFFEVLPTQQAVSLLSRISAWSASSLIAEMSSAAGAAILSKLDYETTASIMRVLSEESRSALLDALPRKLRRDLIVTLTYPTNTVGAKMSVNIVVMVGEQTVGDAFSALRRIKSTRSGVGFVVDESQRLLGAVSAEELLQLPNESRLSDVMDRLVRPLSARASLSSVKSLAAWDDYPHLPVVDRKKILIGALARRTLRKRVVDTSTDPVQRPSLLASVAGAFFHSSVELSRIFIDLEHATDAMPDAQSQSAKGERL
jgi:Mg/Co/Ni transporter MgtE